MPQEAGAGTLLATETTYAVEQSGHEPLEPHWHFQEPAAESRDDSIDETAADERLADGHVAAPPRPIGEQVIDGDREIVVRIHQPRGTRHDTVAIRVGIVGKGDLETILQSHEPGHRVRARRIHANLAVVIHGHEGERGIDHWI